MADGADVLEPSTLPIPRPRFIRVEIQVLRVWPVTMREPTVETARHLFRLCRFPALYRFKPETGRHATPKTCFFCGRRIRQRDFVYRADGQAVPHGQRSRPGRTQRYAPFRGYTFCAPCSDKIHFEIVGDERVMCPA